MVRSMDRNYQVLGLESGSSAESVREAYIELAKKNHPDRGADPARFEEIQEAYTAIVESQEKSTVSTPDSVAEKIVTNISNKMIDLKEEEKNVIIDMIHQAAEGDVDAFDLTTNLGKSGVDIIKRKLLEYSPRSCEAIDFFSEVFLQVRLFDD